MKPPETRAVVAPKLFMVATSSRATLGGMIANDSSGAHAPVYGTTADHISVLEILTSDGRVVIDTVAGVPADYANALLANTFPLISTLTTTDDLLDAWGGG